MKLSRVLGMGLALALLCGGCKSANNSPAAKEAEESSNEVKLKFDQTPSAVQAGLKREAGGAAIGDVDKEEKGGKTIYETDVMINGTNWEIKVAEDGSLISKKVDNEDAEKKGEEKDEKDEKKG